MTDIKQLKDKDGQSFFPVTHKDAIFDSNGDQLNIVSAYSVDELDFSVDKNLIDRVEQLENDLNKTENTKYATTNGVKEFECKDGYVDNIVIEGETLVNLCHYVDGYGIINTTYFKYFDDRITGHDVYTVCFPNLKDGGGLTLRVANGNGDDVETIPVYKGDFKTINIDSSNRIIAFLISLDKYTEEEIINICKTGLIVPGDHTDKPISYFKGLKSVGQGDKIEVLSYLSNKSNKIDLLNIAWKDGHYLANDFTNSDGREIVDSLNLYSYSETYIPIENNTTYLFKNVNWNFCFYDENKQFIPTTCEYPIIQTGDISVGHFIKKTPTNAKYVRLTVLTKDKPIIEVYKNARYDKKQILTTLRSLPNGVKDTIEKRGDKYVLVQRCGEVTLNGSENWYKVTNVTQANTVQFGLRKGNYVAYKGDSEIFFNCDKIPPTEERKWNEDREFIFINPYDYIISISKTRLSTQDLAGFKTWLQSNPVTIVYELETPQIIELPNFNPQTYEGDTTLLLNTGVIQGECEFEVTNSKGSEIEVLKDKVSSLDDNIVEVYNPQLLNGFYKLYSEDDSYIRKYNNVVVINLRLTNPANIPNGTLVFTLPPSFSPLERIGSSVCHGLTGVATGMLIIRNDGNAIIYNATDLSDIRLNIVYMAR